MMAKRASFERIRERLPDLQERHAARMIARSVLGGNTSDMVKSLFEDLNEVKWLLVDVESNSLPALKMFILYLDYFECTSDAWKLRLLTKRKFPNATLKTEKPDMDVDFSLTTLAAVLQVNYHTITTVTHSASPIVPYNITPGRNVDSYHCTGASRIHISSKDLRYGMVFVYLFSDTVARTHNEIDSRKWSQHTQEKCGICYGSMIIVEGPMAKSDEFEKIIQDCIYDMKHFMDEGLRKQTNLLPGRSFFVIHERNHKRFQDLTGGERHPFVLKKDARIELEKDIITGIYQIDVFG